MAWEKTEYASGNYVHFYISKMNALVPSSCLKYMEKTGESQMNQISGFFHFPILVQMKLLSVSQKISEMVIKSDPISQEILGNT